jgi:hypothetical protein
MAIMMQAKVSASLDAPGCTCNVNRQRVDLGVFRRSSHKYHIVCNTQGSMEYLSIWRDAAVSWHA